MIIGLPKESAAGELRVALDPTVVERLCALPTVVVQIQSGCGRGAGFYDDAYEGVQVFDNHADVVANASIVVRVTPPTVAEARQLADRSVLVCQMAPHQHLNVIKQLQSNQITVLAMDLVPRISRAQAMDVLSSQATVAGYKAALLAAELSPRLFPMLTTAAGTIRPSRVVVIGAGVAGLQAIATARRLGAQVEAYDIRRAAKEQIESLGARMIDTGVDAESTGGYARALTKDERQTQHDILAERLSHAHAVICTAAIPGCDAPIIITEDMVEGMLPDTVIVDMAADTGGNCELTRPGETYFHGDTMIVGPLNLPSSGAVHASEMYARNLLNMLRLILPDGKLQLDWNDEILSACLLTRDGQIFHQATAQSLGVTVATFDTSSTNLATEEVNQETSSKGHAVKSAGAGAVPGANKDTRENDSRFVTSQSVDKLSAEDALPKLEFTHIDGIGPALQIQLYAFGFSRYVQLAALDDAGRDRLEQQLELEVGQILRENWSAQAAQLDARI